MHLPNFLNPPSTGLRVPVTIEPTSSEDKDILDRVVLPVLVSDKRQTGRFHRVWKAPIGVQPLEEVVEAGMATVGPFVRSRSCPSFHRAIVG